MQVDESQENIVGARPQKDLKSIKVDSEIHRQMKTASSALAQDLGKYVEELWRRHRDGISVACPVCDSSLLAGIDAVDVVCIGGSAETITVSADLRETIERFLHFVLTPHIEDKSLHDIFLKEILKKPHYAGNVSASHGTTL